MHAEFIKILEVAPYFIMGLGLLLAAVGLWASFNEESSPH